MEIFRLFGSVFIDNEAANKKIDETDNKGKGFAGTLASSLGTAVKWGIGIAGAATAAVGGMVALANKTAGVADEIDKLSERTGIGRERLQELKYAANQSGVEFDVLEKAVKTMSTTTMNAVNGSKTASAAFKQLGISVTDSSGKIKSTNDLFNDAVMALADMDQGVQRNALGNQIFGKGYTEMLPLLNAGSKGIKELTDRSRELGLVMSDEAIAANVKFGDTMQDVKDSLGAVFGRLMTTALPVLQTFIDIILNNMPTIQAVLGTVFGFLGTLIDGFVKGIQLIVGWVRQWLADNQSTVDGIRTVFMGFFDAVINLFGGFIQWVSQMWATWGDSIMSVAKFVWDMVVNNLRTAFKLITDVFNIFAALFRGDWEGLWNGVKQFFADIWSGILGGLKATINLIIRAVNGMINGLNKIHWTIPDWVPLLGGLSWGFNLPKIPELYKGGDILESGWTRVGEKGPEDLFLPRGARVQPLASGPSGGVVFERGAFDGAIITDDYGVDRLMDRVMERLAGKGVRLA